MPSHLDAINIISRYSLSRTGFWRLRQLVNFPQPFTVRALPRKLFWSEAEIAAWFAKNQMPAVQGEPLALRESRGRKTQHHQSHAQK